MRTVVGDILFVTFMAWMAVVLSSCGGKGWATRSYVESLEDCLEKITIEELKNLAQVDSDAQELIESGVVAGAEVERLLKLLTKNCSLDATPRNFWQENTLRISISEGQLALDVEP